jgi:hypothetical protein
VFVRYICKSNENTASVAPQFGHKGGWDFFFKTVKKKKKYTWLKAQIETQVETQVETQISTKFDQIWISPCVFPFLKFPNCLRPITRVVNILESRAFNPEFQHFYTRI